jgi:hypothetical protein
MNETAERPGFWAVYWSVFVAGLISSTAVGALGVATRGGSSLAAVVIPLVVSTVIGAYIFRWVLLQYSGWSIDIVNAAILVFVGSAAMFAFRTLVGISTFRAARIVQPSAAGWMTAGLLYSWGGWVVGALASYQLFRLLAGPARVPSDQLARAPSGRMVSGRFAQDRSRRGSQLATANLVLWASVLMLLAAAVFFVLAARHAFA